ncbi:MAG: hypothetical protein ABI778_01155 [Ignavibacteriota bacterium]
MKEWTGGAVKGRADTRLARRKKFEALFHLFNENISFVIERLPSIREAFQKKRFELSSRR